MCTRHGTSITLSVAAFCLLALPLSARASTETVSQPVVYGIDDRVDPVDHPSEPIRRLAQESIVTLIPRPVLDVSDPSNVRLRSRSLGASMGLCEGERFTDQPSAGICSGTLIGPDLVLTAGHCFGAGEATCPLMFAVFGYEWQDGSLTGITSDDIFGCRRLVAHADSEAGGVTRDYAVFQLDRAVSAYTPANVAPTRPNLVSGDPFVLIGSPSGIPIKIDDGGRVRDPRLSVGDYFTGTPDTFGGNSGSGVFAADSLDLFGVLISGATDYVSSGGCNRVNVCAESACGGENMLYARAAIDAFCAVGTDEVLCGTTSSCGDGYCAYDESPTSCPSDCTAPTCGDGFCGIDEWTTCPADCQTVIPPTWTCEVAYYGTLDGCDCDCGAYDPDCALGQEVVNCGFGQTCGLDGRCEDDFLGLCDCAASERANKVGAFTLVALLALTFAATRRRFAGA